jgi:hypothetical protein
MDISKLTHGAKVVLGSTIAFLIVSFFNWFEYHGQGFASMWHGIGVLAGLLAIALIVWEAIHLAGMKVGVPLHPAMAGAVLAILVALFAFIRFISIPGGEFGAAAGVGRTFWAWLGLVLAIAAAVGAFLNMKEIGLTMADMGSSMKAAAGSAAAAAKDATDKGPADEPAAPAAPQAPAAPEAPAVPEAPAAPAPPSYAPPAPEPPAETPAETPAAEGDQPPPHTPA